MADRRSSSARKSGSRQGSARERAARPAADGKVAIQCSHCGAQYRLPEEHLGQTIQCSQCKSSFLARAGRAKVQPKSPLPIIAGTAGGVLVLILIGVLIRGGGAPDAPPPPPPVAKAPDLGWQNERVQAVVKWAQAIKANDRFVVDSLTDFAALQRQLGIEPGSPFDAADPATRERLKDLVVERLRSGDEALVFRDFSIDDGSLPEAAMATASSGRVLLGGAPDDLAKYPSYQARADVAVDFAWQSPSLRVTGFEVVKLPRAKVVKTDGHVRHKEIPKAKEVERNIDGQVVKVVEAELVPLGHLESTPEPLRKEIDDLIAKLIEMDAPGAQANRAGNRLDEIGRPAIPRLLNRFYEIKGETKDEIEALGRIDRLLARMTGVRFNYSTVTQVGQQSGWGAEQRESALKRWYAWWADWHDRDYTYNIQKEDDETLFLTDEQRKAREAAAGKPGTAPAPAKPPDRK